MRVGPASRPFRVGHEGVGVRAGEGGEGVRAFGGGEMSALEATLRALARPIKALQARVEVGYAVGLGVALGIVEEGGATAPLKHAARIAPHDAAHQAAPRALGLGVQARAALAAPDRGGHGRRPAAVACQLGAVSVVDACPGGLGISASTWQSLCRAWALDRVWRRGRRRTTR